jgi:spermidine synthase
VPTSAPAPPMTREPVFIPGDSGRPARGPVLALVTASFLALFLELAMIRFINSTVQVVAYFNNFLIVSAFLGLGAGSCLAAGRRNLFAAMPVVFPLVVAIMVGLSAYGFEADLSEVVFWALRKPERSLGTLPTILLVFCANFAFFVPLGYKLGACLRRFENRLVGYGYDLLGSLAGVLAFALVSYWQLPPSVWFGLAGLALVGLIEGSAARHLAGLVSVLVVVVLSTLPADGLWSPYYKISAVPYEHRDPGAAPLGYAIIVDRMRIQDALRFSPELEQSPLRLWGPYYRLPFSFVTPKTVLVLGGGSGNDATVALGFHPERVDVVEIDPVLVSLGRTLHPHRPYRDPAVRTVVNDARAFLRQTTDTYDLVIMNALDSHHQLPGLSTLRLESFIYTVEAFRDVKRHLGPGSFFVVHLGSTRPWMGERLYWSLTEAFGREPRLYTTEHEATQSVAFVYGPEGRVPGGNEVQPVEPDRFRAAKGRTRLATDDWPHLYLADNRVPRLYLEVLTVVVLLAMLVSARAWRSLGAARGSHFFLLGAGFMLLETRSITKAALLFGSTWIVNAIVIASILLVIWLGNLLLLKGVRIGKMPCYLALIGSLLLGYVVPIAPALAYGFWPRVAWSVVWIGAPIFFAALIFSGSFRGAEDASGAFGVNLLGVVVGGALEYSSMVYGLDFLYLIAIGIYLLAWLTDLGGTRQDFRAAPAPAA